MTKIAVDVVLLPPEDVMDKLIELDQKLLNRNPDKPLLDKVNCFPHLSLAMGVVEEKYLTDIEKILMQIAKQFKPIPLTASQLGKSKVSVDNTVELKQLHEKLMNQLSSFFSSEVDQSMFYGGQVRDISLSWARDYVSNSAFEKFAPHFSLGIGETAERNIGLNFTAERLALCHLGNYNTCRKILFETKLA